MPISASPTIMPRHIRRNLLRRDKPQRHRLQLLRQLSFSNPKVARGKLDLAEHGDAGGHGHVTEAHGGPAPASPPRPRQCNLRGLHRLGVVVEVAPIHVGDLLVEVQLLHEVGLRAVQVDRVVVELAERRDLVEGADDALTRALVLDGVDHPGDVAQADPGRDTPNSPSTTGR